MDDCGGVRTVHGGHAGPHCLLNLVLDRVVEQGRRINKVCSLVKNYCRTLIVAGGWFPLMQVCLSFLYGVNNLKLCYYDVDSDRG